ncbi:MAG TPA: N-acetyl-gamma-glutamyl-phosphate reductase [Candidatus Limnocylindrales bacterium]|nr:N-acetyl-gamma-glutamyl-phosphate reductase [Candidatus Limnocylindrales bacterium]
MIKVAVLGATGYTGVELIRLLHGHPEAEILFLSSESHAGTRFSDVHPQFRGCVEQKLDRLQIELIPEWVDVVFCALPHGQSMTVVPALLGRGFKVIDLSADFRLKQPSLYREWYDLDHPFAELLSTAVYGLPEINRDEIKNAELIANPGCYPTSILLALAPLLVESLVDLKTIIIDAKSGVSGAGRSPKQAFHFPECTENFKAYRVAGHQHIPEIEQELGRLAGEKLRVTFTPHLVPMVRGILSTIYLELHQVTQEDVYSCYHRFYTGQPFVRVIEPPDLPETRLVRGSNYCDLAVRLDKRTDRVIVIAAIDNLVKGASGQAVQNMNILFSIPEITGLGQPAYL